jgi:UDP-N-acetylmuramate: L-alanyl-gamma-D-glutamyl-meso-diaminopimelate ligase
MGGLAVLAREADWRVTGCDSGVYPPMSDQLRALGIDLIDGYGEDQLALNPDLWVIGNAITRGNPLAEAILDRRERFQSGPAWLRDHILRRKWVLAVAGTHGKTTTSAMLTHILDSAGKAPGFLIGGVPLDFSVSARLTESELFVIEADEYDTAFFDKRSKFVHYLPKTAVITNIEFDHADIFDDLASIERQFHHLIRILPRSGRLVVNETDQATKRVLTKGCWTPIAAVGSTKGWHWQNSDSLAFGDRVVGELGTDLGGLHNRMNALGAIAAAQHAGVAPELALAALRSFRGVRRRLELRGAPRGIAVYDDFAHHPTAIQATLQGLRARVGRARIIAVLEPRSNTMKLGTMKEALPQSLAEADAAFVYSSGLGWDPAPVFAAAGSEAKCIGDLDAMVEAIAQVAQTGDHVLIMSNGSFGNVHEKLMKRLGGDPGQAFTQ